MCCHQSANSHTKLLELPRELRDRIIHHLFDEFAYDVYRANGGEHVFTLEYGQILIGRTDEWVASIASSEADTTPPKCLPPFWLLTCKQLLSEGLAQFARGARCTSVVHKDDYSPRTRVELRLARDRLLAPLIQELYVEAAPVMQSQKGFLRFEVFDPMVDDDVLSVLGYRTVLPKAQSLMVEISTWSLPLYDGTDFHLPEYRPGFKNYWYFPGSKYKDVHFLIPMPALAGRYIVTEAAVNERVWNLAEMSRALPQLQACLFGLGESLTTDYAFGSDEGTVEKSWRIRDWIDSSTYTWHMTMQRTDEHPSSPQVFQYAGLYHFTAPYLERDPAKAETIKETPIFSRDKKAQFGTCSWSCSESGETVWVQDGQIGSQTGYRSEPEQGHLHNVASIADQTASAQTDMP